jgi:hypothetical protein
MTFNVDTSQEFVGSFHLIKQDENTRAAILSVASDALGDSSYGSQVIGNAESLRASRYEFVWVGRRSPPVCYCPISLWKQQNAVLPDVVKLPAGINLGSSSFYDGFGGTDPGWTSLNYLRWNALTSIKDGSGHNSPLFVDPCIDVVSTLFHAVYVPPIQLPNGAIAFEALLPIVDFQSRFNPIAAVLHDDGLGAGDMTFGAAYQSKPILLGNQSVLSWRVDLDFTAPTGRFDGNKDLNQGSDFWSLEPYFAMTLLPVPKWEVSARFNYIYNFATSHGSDPPQIPGFTFHGGQAGQAGWINFASSYEVAEGVRPGLMVFG